MELRLRVGDDVEVRSWVGCWVLGVGSWGRNQTSNTSILQTKATELILFFIFLYLGRNSFALQHNSQMCLLTPSAHSTQERIRMQKCFCATDKLLQHPLKITPVKNLGHTGYILKGEKKRVL